MRGDVAVVGLGLVEVLDQVIPDVPFPDDLAGGLAGRLDFDEGSRAAGGRRPFPAGGRRRWPLPRSSSSQTIISTLPLGSRQMSWCGWFFALANLKSQTSSPSQVNS